MSGKAEAAITISNFEFTTRSVEFTIAGTLPSGSPELSSAVIYFANADFRRDPGAVLPAAFVAPDSVTWTGAQALSLDQPLFTVGTNYYDAFAGLNFLGSLSGGEAINGTVSAVFPDNTFNPLEVEQFDVFWGRNSSLGIKGGILLTTVPVPEPSVHLVCVLAGLGSLMIRRRTVAE